MPGPIMKTCQRCGEEKPLTEFYHNSTKSDYHNGICMECQLEVNRENLSEDEDE